MRRLNWLGLIITFLVFAVAINTAYAGEKKYGPGASDDEIKIGNTMPYSGPASAYSTVGKTIAAYFTKLNKEQGGINGRKITFISLDDGYSPPKTKEQHRRLVEKDKVLFVFCNLGTPTNMAVYKYLNKKKVPHVFPTGGGSQWDQPQKNPWTIGWQPTYATEGRIYANHILKNHPNGKVAILYQNDDFGRDYLHGIKEAFGDKYQSMVVGEEGYDTASPTIDSQILKLKDSGANIFINVTSTKFAAQAIRKLHELNWKPIHYLVNASASVAAVFKPAGLDKCKGIISAQYLMDPTDPEFAKTPGIIKWKKFMDEYYPEGDQTDYMNVYGYSQARTLEHVLKRCGDNLTRENVKRQAESLNNLQLDTMIEGIKLTTSPTDHRPMETLQLIQFDGKGFVRIGGLIKTGNDLKM